MAISRKNFWIFALVGLAVILITGIKPSIFYYEFRMWYLGFHALVEFFTVAAALIVSFYAFVNYQVTQSARYLVFGVVFLASAIVDVLHILSYGGMPQTIIFPAVNTTIYFWLAARFIVAIGLLISALIKPSTKFRLSIAGSVAVALAIAVAVFLTVYYLAPQLPTMIKLFGLAIQKIEIEYFLMFLLMATSLLYWRESKNLGAILPYYLLLFLIFTIFSEFEFTLYPGAFYLHNMIGHIFKFGAYIFLLFHFTPWFKKLARSSQ